jgi:hypothetical protein
MKGWPGNEPSSKRWEDRPRDYLFDFYKEALNSRQTLNFISRINTGKRESWFNIVTEHAGKKAAHFLACARIFLFAITCVSSLESLQSSMDRQILYARLRQVVTSLLWLRPELNSRPVHVKTVVDKMEFGEVFLGDFRINPSSTIPPTPRSH